ncbi:MAG: hypothetical protein QW507_01095 [Candidatus Nanoarchaeia archaeon]|nr:hypothetical protein [Candidatus Haiyanarchaeum thermophilum]MCW1303411.1 hypothetical protein [Candidatus Haiyanarchaeum thermophilum]MCW1303902.1 hypothetical protein [Candidatus Haiyanarchaeum thermophilum]MCW1306888.1 hypothetical protein [Candidatus Haiyanarchaeum thermophilum]MCW1307437.1 hypothetical protein [Candidatus Haiyanarchaeum thermophilum]
MVTFGYDIRGIYRKEIGENFAFELGSILSTYGKRVAVGYDCRTSSIHLHNSLVNALLEGGCKVVTIGMIPNPVCYFYTFHKKLDFGVYITASHLPSEYNGFKLIRGDGTSFTSELQQIREALQQGGRRMEERVAQGSHEVDIMADQEYINHLIPKFKVLGKPLIVVDCMYGSSSNMLRIFESLGCRLIALRAKPLGDFGGIRPEPLEENLTSLREKVVKNQALFGVAYDGDADRAVFVDDLGRVVDGSKAIAIFCKYLLRRAGKVVISIDSSIGLEKIIQDLGGEVIWSKVGHSNIEESLVKHNAIFGGEQSSHFYFNDFYPFSDGILATLYMLEILTTSRERLSRIVDSIQLPAYQKINLNLENTERRDKMFELLKQRLAEKFELNLELGYIIFRVDENRVVIRKSETEPFLRISVESYEETKLDELKQLIMGQIEELSKQL